ncbi:MAG TPA: hypothetical protein VK404_16070, partial [Spirosoma sp.]|nr:hypothetical protein [Spirosoma sp.]
MRPLLLLTLLLNWSVAIGQEKPLMLPGRLPAAGKDIGPYTTFYEDDSVDTLSAAVILTKPFWPSLQQLTDRLSTRKPITKWLRFTLQNNSSHQSI